MKRLTSFIMVFLLIFTVSGCGKNSDKEKSSNDESPDVENVVDTEEKEDDKEDIGKTIEAPTNVRTDTTEENPAQVGEWVQTSIYNPQRDGHESGEYDIVYYRITSINRGNDNEKVKSFIDIINNGDYSIIADPLEEDMEYGAITYDIYFPKEFVSDGSGIVTLDLDFDILSTHEDYSGFTSVYDFSISWMDLKEEMLPGQIFTGGRGLFAIPKVFPSVLLEESNSSSDEDFIYSYVQSK